MHWKTASIQRNLNNSVLDVSGVPPAAIRSPKEPEPLVQEDSDDEILEWLQQHAAQLPVMAVAVYEALDLLSAKPAKLENLVTVVGSEPALAAQVVRLAAADTPDGWYSLKEALVLAGVTEMQRLLVEVPLVTSFDPAHGRLTMFRRHAQLTALLSETIAVECGYRRPEEAHLAGLLHQLGELPGLTQAGEPAADYVRIGGVLASWWGFPENLQHVIRGHDDAPAAGAFLTRAASLASDFCARMGGLPRRGDVVPKHDVESIELVRRHLPLLPPHRQTALAEAMDFEFKRWAAQFLKNAARPERLRQNGACL